MKIIKYILYASLVVLISCNNNEKEKEETLAKYDSMNEVNHYQDTMIMNFVKAFNNVEEQLDSITRKQHAIINITNNGDMNETQKQRIDQNIIDINLLMINNRKKLVMLSSKVKSTGSKNSALLKTIDIINHQLLEKDKELDDLNKELMFLNSELAQLKTKVNYLVSENEIQANTIKNQVNENQTAYYIIDTKKSLEKNKIISIDNGFLGMNKTVKINSQIENGMFNMIDYTLVTVIPIATNKMEMVTVHPEDSYTIYRDEQAKFKITSIIITNPEKFWSASKYLVVISEE
jgi:chromosome segregation ATPase